MMARERVLGALAEAATTTFAAVAALAATLAIDAEPAPGILAVVLSISLARSHLDHGFRERLEAAVANDDPSEARRCLAQFDFSEAQRRHVEALLDAWEQERGEA